MKILRYGKDMFTGAKILFECKECGCMFAVAKKICGYCEGKNIYTCPNCLKIVKSDFETEVFDLSLLKLLEVIKAMYNKENSSP